MTVVEILGSGGVAAVLTALGSAGKGWLDARRAARADAEAARVTARVTDAKVVQEAKKDDRDHEASILRMLLDLARETALGSDARATKVSEALMTNSRAMDGLKESVAGLRESVGRVHEQLNDLDERLAAIERVSGIVERPIAREKQS